jgi:hypothetical protein
MQKSREKLIFVTFETEFFFFWRFDQNQSGTVDKLHRLRGDRTASCHSWISELAQSQSLAKA